VWKPFVPAGVEATWGPVKEAGRQAWYFNQNYPWPGMLLGAPIAGLWYWCTDQYVVQRTLGATNQTQARRGTILAAFLTLVPLVLFILPGMIALALARTGRGGGLETLVDAAGNVVPAAARTAFPLMVRDILPAGVRGLVVAGLLAALMSSLAGVFNACSTLFTIDFYSKLHPGATQARLVWVGRITTAVMVFVALLWIPVIQGASGLYDYLLGISAFIGPPIVSVFVLGVVMKRLNAAGALAALIAGFAMGLFRLAVDTPVTLGLRGFQNGYAPGSVLWLVNNTYFQYYSVLICLVSAVTMIAVSYATAAPSDAQIRGLAFATVTPEQRLETRRSWNHWDVVNSAIVLGVIAAAYVYFSG
jgi:SSS family solute:Na+ symporter